jgi:alpha-mannosidase
MGGGGEVRSNVSYPVFAQRPVGVSKTSILKGRIELFYKSGQYEKVNLLAYVFLDLSHLILIPAR